MFEHNIRPLFREDDRESMKFAFDLWSYTDVKSQAKAIVQRWIDSGMAP